MRSFIHAVVFVAAAAGVVGAEPVSRDAPPPRSTTSTTSTSTTSTNATLNDATFKDIQNTMGFVPQFLRAAPPTLLPAVWQGIKNFQLGTETRLDGKTKELIGLAVAAQIPCEYCVQFHTQAAKLNGATDQEIQEAVGMAAVTREVSTMLNGMQVDKVQFKKDLDRMVQNKKQQARR